MTITKGFIENMIVSASEEIRAHIVGRACLVLFRNQTCTEKAHNDTEEANNIGFTSGDARQGSITAKYYIKHGKLENWQAEQWLKRDIRGTMRIAKYWKQLSAAAEAKASEKNRMAA